MTFPKILKTQKYSVKTPKNKKFKQSCKEPHIKKIRKQTVVKIENVKNAMFENSKISKNLP